MYSSSSTPGWKTILCVRISSCRSIPYGSRRYRDQYPGRVYNFSTCHVRNKPSNPSVSPRATMSAVCEVAKKLGMYEEVTEGKSVRRSGLNMVFDESGLPEFISWEEFKKKQYFRLPDCRKTGRKTHPAGRKFYEDPEENPLPTPSGKLEFYSERLAKHFPDDKERPPIPKWIEKSEMHDERISSSRAKKYPSAR